MRFIPDSVQLWYLRWMIGRRKREQLRLRRAIRKKEADIYKDRWDSLVSYTGGAAMYWVRVERHIDTLILVIHSHGGSDKIQPDFPASLKAKLTYLRRAFRDIPALSALRDGANGIVDDVHQLKEIRHDCLHGVGVVFRKREQYAFYRIRYAREGPKLVKREYEPKEVLDFLIRLFFLVHHISGFTMKVVDALGLKEDEKLLREFAIRVTSLPVPRSDELGTASD